MRHVVLGQRVDDEVLIARRPLARPVLVALLLRTKISYDTPYNCYNLNARFVAIIYNIRVSLLNTLAANELNR